MPPFTLVTLILLASDTMIVCLTRDNYECRRTVLVCKFTGENARVRPHASQTKSGPYSLAWDRTDQAECILVSTELRVPNKKSPQLDLHLQIGDIPPPARNPSADATESECRPKTGRQILLYTLVEAITRRMDVG